MVDLFSFFDSSLIIIKCENMAVLVEWTVYVYNWNWMIRKAEWLLRKEKSSVILLFASTCWHTNPIN